MGEISGVGVEVTADVPPPDGQRVGNGAFGGIGVAAGEMEVLLEVGGFDIDRGV